MKQSFLPLLVRTSALFVVLGTFGACPADLGSNGSGGHGSGGSGSGGSGSGGSGSGGSASGGSHSGGSGSGGSASGGSGSGGSASGGSGSGGSASGGSGSGGSSSGACNSGATGGSSSANWAGVKNIIGFYCGGPSCHNAGQPPNLFPADDATLYKTLTEYKVAKCGGRVLVKPCAPEDSAFYRTQADPTMCDPLPRMPFGCGPGSCTVPDDLEDIRQWIAKGAPKD